MTTVKHLERLFSGHQHRRLYTELASSRPEGGLPTDGVLSGAVPTSALAMIRMDELSQAHTPLFRRMLNVVLASQESDGGWGDPMVTALCVRALMLGNGQGVAVERGLAYLASMQRPEGIWPSEPLRRMPADALASAFIMLQLGDRDAFRRAVRFEEAVDWFAEHRDQLDAQTRRLWEHAAMRCRVTGRRFTPHLWTVTRPAA